MKIKGAAKFKLCQVFDGRARVGGHEKTMSMGNLVDGEEKVIRVTYKVLP